MFQLPHSATAHKGPPLATRSSTASQLGPWQDSSRLQSLVPPMTGAPNPIWFTGHGTAYIGRIDCKAVR